MILKEIWESTDYKSFYYESFNNLNEELKEETQSSSGEQLILDKQ